MKKLLASSLATLLLLCCCASPVLAADAAETADKLHDDLRYQVEFALIPALLKDYEDEFFGLLHMDGSAFLLHMYQVPYEDAGVACPYAPADFSYEEKTVDGLEVRVLILPKIHLNMPNCERMLILKDPKTGTVQCFTVEKSLLDTYMLCSPYPVMHMNFGACTPENAEELALEIFKEQ